MIDLSTNKHVQIKTVPTRQRVEVHLQQFQANAKHLMRIRKEYVDIQGRPISLDKSNYVTAYSRYTPKVSQFVKTTTKFNSRNQEQLESVETQPGHQDDTLRCHTLSNSYQVVDGQSTPLGREVITFRNRTRTPANHSLYEQIQVKRLQQLSQPHPAPKKYQITVGTNWQLPLVDTPAKFNLSTQCDWDESINQMILLKQYELEQARAKTAIGNYHDDQSDLVVGKRITQKPRFENPLTLVPQLQPSEPLPQNTTTSANRNPLAINQETNRALIKSIYENSKKLRSLTPAQRRRLRPRADIS